MTRIPFAGLVAAGALTLGLQPAGAASFDFAMTFDGTDITLDPGSDTPAGTALSPGDMFDVTLRAAAGDFWRVTDAVDDAFVPLSFEVSPSGTRIADIDTTWTRNGSTVASQTETDASQSFVHVGAQLWSLAAGVEFDTVTIAWAFDSGDAATIEGAPDIFGDFGDTLFFRGGPSDGAIAYVEGAVIPLPAGLPLLAAGLGGLALLRRRA